MQPQRLTFELRAKARQRINELNLSLQSRKTPSSLSSEVANSEKELELNDASCFEDTDGSQDTLTERGKPHNVSSKAEELDMIRVGTVFEASKMPRLGYDWYAGLLDTNDSVENLSDSFFDELAEFRKMNIDECTCNVPAGSDNWVYDDVGRSSEETSLVESKPSYRINERLFPEEQPRPRGPVPTEMAQYTLVSIPERVIQSPKKMSIPAKEDYNPARSLSLRKHCLQGWECAQPAIGRPPKYLDLKTAARGNVH
eukprot:m.186155 g.186155  ORF g.186155 m.186155 type:complete len:256 (+) comp15587_c0_seq6:202-969(+)